MQNTEHVDLLIEADLLWREISIGDLIMLEDDLQSGEQLLLHAHQPYQVLAKLDGVSGQQRFAVESDQTHQVVEVYPVQLCSYKEAEQPIYLS